MGVPIARCELLDANAVRAVNKHDKLTLREAPMLLMEFHGSAAGVEEQAETVQEIAHEHGGEEFQWATHAGGAHQAVDRAPPRLLRRPADASPGCRTVTHRHLRADLAPGRVRSTKSVAEAERRACRTTSSATSATATSTWPT